MASKRHLPKATDNDDLGSHKRRKLARLLSQPELLLETLEFLDRFSLDAVRLSTLRMKQLVDKYMPAHPLRVLRFVLVQWPIDDPAVSYEATLVAEHPSTNLSKSLSAHGEQVFRDVFAQCVGCAVESFKFMDIEWNAAVLQVCGENLPRIPIRNVAIRDNYYTSDEDKSIDKLISMLNGTETIYFDDFFDDIGDDTARLCAERGIAKLGFTDADDITDAGVFDFCFSTSPVNGGFDHRTLHADDPQLSPSFFQELVERCLKHDSGALPNIIVETDDGFNTTAYDAIAKDHEVDDFYRCRHFQFETAAGVPFEVVVRQDDEGTDSLGESALELRHGHGLLEQCRATDKWTQWKEMFDTD